MAETVIGGTLLRVRENLVGFLGFLEVRLRIGIIRIAIRVMLHGETPVGLL